MYVAALSRKKEDAEALFKKHEFDVAMNCILGVCKSDEVRAPSSAVQDPEDRG